MNDLSGFKVAVIASDGFEESELTEPVKALKDANADVFIVGPKGHSIQGVRHFDKGESVKLDRQIRDLESSEIDAVMLPGGALNADFLRVDKQLQDFLRNIVQQSKPVAAICHAPWELVSADLVRGRTLTSYHTIQDDVRNAGGHWVDQEVVVDGNFVTSRQPSDLPAFNREMISLFAKSRHDRELKPRSA